MYISCADDGGFGDGEKQLRGPDALLTLDNNMCFEERGFLLALAELDGLPASRHPVYSAKHLCSWQKYIVMVIGK